MRRSEYYDKHQNLNIDPRELERKYQYHLREEDSIHFIHESFYMDLQIQSGSSPGGEVLDLTINETVEEDFIDPDYFE